MVPLPMVVCHEPLKHAPQASRSMGSSLSDREAQTAAAKRKSEFQKNRPARPTNLERWKA
jgi:hypothetical protein